MNLGGGGGAGYHQREKCIENRSQLVSNRIAAAAVIPIQNEVANKIFMLNHDLYIIEYVQNKNITCTTCTTCNPIV